MKKKKLKQKLKEALRQISQGPTAAVADAGPTLSAWLETYRRAVAERGYHQQTLRNRAASLKHVESMWGEMPLRGIRPVDIASKLKLFTPHTARRVLGELRDVYTEAVNNGAAETNPAAHVKPPKAAGLRKRLTLDTLQAMLVESRTCSQRWVHAMLLLALHTGQRRADLAKMRFDDVVDGHLRVEQQKKARKLIGWRMADYTDETMDRDLARNWARHMDVLPVFEGDINTKLALGQPCDTPAYCGSVQRCTMMDSVTDAARDVWLERRRQIEVEGYSRQSDADLHDSNDLAQSAAFYAMAEVGHEGGRVVWPWDEDACKVKDRYRNFVRAAALLIAAADLELARGAKR
jgi:hypothetical protein